MAVERSLAQSNDAMRFDLWKVRVLAMLNGFTVFVALVTAAIGIGVALLEPELALPMLSFGHTEGVMFLCIWTLAVLPLAFAMPRLRASFFGRLWRVPSQTFLMPRWLVQCFGGALAGNVVAYSFMAAMHDHGGLWLAGSCAFVTVAFAAGAWSRFRQHPKTEFTLTCRMFWRPRR